MSDGKKGIIFVNNSQEYKNSCTIKYLNSKILPPREKVTSVLVIPFIDDEEIVVTINQRGTDIAGGHVEDKDATFEDTAHREVMEETGVEIENVMHIATLESDYFGSMQNKLTYILIYSARVKTIQEYNGYMECTGRKIMNYRDFLSEYKGKMINTDLMRLLIELRNKK